MDYKFDGHVWSERKRGLRLANVQTRIATETSLSESREALSWLGLLCDTPSTESYYSWSGKAEVTIVSDPYVALLRPANCAWNIKSPVPCVRAALETVRRILRGRIKQAAAMNARRTRYCVSQQVTPFVARLCGQVDEQFDR